MRHQVWPSNDFGPEATTPATHPVLWLPWDEFVAAYCDGVAEQEQAAAEVPTRVFVSDDGMSLSRWALVADVKAWYATAFRHDPVEALAAAQRVEDMLERLQRDHGGVWPSVG